MLRQTQLELKGTRLLVVEDLQKYSRSPADHFQKEVASVKAVDGVSFAVREGRRRRVGESGCGSRRWPLHHEAARADRPAR